MVEIQIKPCNAACKSASEIIRGLGLQGKRKEAVRAADEALRADPACRLSAALRAWALLEDGQARRCLDQARASAKMHPDEACFALIEGAALISFDLHDEALASLERASRLCPSSGLPHALAACACAEAGNCSRARDEARQARRLASKSAEALAYAAGAMITCCRTDEAHELARAALKADPDSARAHSMRVHSLMFLDRHDEAHEAAKEMVRAVPSSPTAVLIRAAALVLCGRPADAYADVIKARRLGAKALDGLADEAPKDAKEAGRAVLSAYSLAALNDPQTGLPFGNSISVACALETKLAPESGMRDSGVRDRVYGHVLESRRLAGQGRLKGALAEIDAAALIDAKNAALHAEKSDALLGLGRLEGALKSVDAALRLDPKSAMLHSNRGTLLAQMGMLAEAEAEFDAALAIDPGLEAAQKNRANAASIRAGTMDLPAIPPNLQAMYTHASSLAAARNLREAIASYKRIARLDSGSVEPHYCLGLLLLKDSRYGESVRAYDRALAIDPDNKVAHCNRGISLYLAGRLKEALASLDRALSIDPQYRLAGKNRRAVLGKMRDAGLRA